jgi:hypothetical protein
MPSLSWNPHVIPSITSPKLLSLDTCLDPTKLSSAIGKDDTVVVVGSSHSAILILKNLSEMTPRPKIINFYIDALKYAAPQEGGWILYDNTGLKGTAATWARDNLENGGEGVGIMRVNCRDEAVYKEWMPKTSHIVYAIGFKRRGIPNVIVDGKVVGEIGYDNKEAKLTGDGKVLENAYGFGIAFPQETVDPVGNVETSVGIWKFRKYVTKVIKGDDLDARL